MDSQQFSLCWNNFHSNMSSGFQSLWKEQDLVDVTLSVEGKCLKAHKMVLSICSPYFKELFRSNPCEHPIVILHDVNYNAFYSLLHFIYQGEVRVKQSELATFMKVAESLKVKGLTDTDGNTQTKEETLNGLPMKEQMNRIRLPLKKPIAKPVQNIRNTARRSASNSPTRHSPPPKIPKLEDVKSEVKPSNSLPILPVVKQEPIDPDEQIQNEEDPLGIDEDSSFSGRMPVMTVMPVSTGADTSSPGTLQCIIGKRGLPRLIVDGYTFYKKSTYKNKCFWYCKANKSHKCAAVCWSVNGLIVKWPEAHTHGIIPEVIIPGEDKIVPIEILTKILIECARRTGPELITISKTF